MYIHCHKIMIICSMFETTLDDIDLAVQFTLGNNIFV